MGWYLRKSFKLGLFRINLSKSGLGYSFGIKGARIGTGPRGSYVHLGRHGVYYRDSLRSDSASPETPPLVEASQGAEITSASAFQLHESSADALIAEIRERRARIAWAPTVLLLVAFAMILGFVEELRAWIPLAFAFIAAGAFPVLRARDHAHKILHLEYELDEEGRNDYIGLTNSFRVLGSSSGLWRVVREQAVVDPKYSSGAGKLVDRKPATVKRAAPKCVIADIEAWELIHGNQSFYFFPDQILVFEGPEIGAVGYDQLEVAAQDVRFVEDSGVPVDAEIIGQTWRYPNRDGGPDRRFSYNPSIPVVQYGEVFIRSTSGVNLILQVSNTGKARQFATGLIQYVEKKRVRKTIEPLQQ